MKRLLLCLLAAATTALAQAQIVKWLIPPAYDKIRVATSNNVVITDSANQKTLWTPDGKRLATTDEQLFDYNDRRAVLIKRGTSTILGFYDEQGHFTSLSGYRAAHGNPNFSGGCLLVRSGNAFRYLDVYGNPIVLRLGGRATNEADIAFASHLSSDHTGIVIIKRTVYLFNSVDQSLTPLGDLDKVKVDYNEMMVPRMATTSAQTYYFDQQEPPAESNSPLGYNTENGKYALYCDSVLVLPAQLDRLVHFFGLRAFVQQEGRYGMIGVFKDQHYRLSMNNGADIAFKHQKTKTTIRLALPSGTDAKTARLEVEAASGCEIDKSSRRVVTDGTASYLEYDCTLTIPKAISDEMAQFTYPVQVYAGGLLSASQPLTVNGYYHKYFSIDFTDDDIKLNKNNLLFTFDISAEKEPGKETIYPSSVNVITESLKYNLTKLSETSYRCTVDNLKEGINIIIIQIKEPGCPPATYPFEVTYTRPVAKTKEKVTIKKHAKQPAPIQQKPTTPHLEI